MKSDFLLAVNGGSSSLKFALYRRGSGLQRQWRGKIDRMGPAGAAITIQDEAGRVMQTPTRDVHDLPTAAEWLIGRLREKISKEALCGIGHRVVYGGQELVSPTLVAPAILKTLHTLSSLDPDHLPAELALLECFQAHWPNIPQVVCFDTAFHHALPREAQLIALPRDLRKKGLRRYGFHGISYAYLLQALRERAGELAERRVIFCHLGSGASLAATRNGKSIETTMGFTPTSGLPMSTRSGDLDPEIGWFLFREGGLSPEAFHRMVNHESGLLGISGISGDIRDLLAHELQDPRAAEAISYFCYQVRKNIGALAAVLGGLDALVFSGGIGENLPQVRHRIGEGLRFLGVEISSEHNAQNLQRISPEGTGVPVWVIPTDEESQIARETEHVLQQEGRLS